MYDAGKEDLAAASFALWSDSSGQNTEDKTQLIFTIA